MSIIQNTVPKLRFPEFEGEFEKDKLINLSNEKLSNGVFNDPKKVGSGYYLVNVKDMYTDLSIDKSTLTKLNIDFEEFSRNQVNYGDILFTRSSLVKEGIAHSVVNLNKDNDITFDGHLIKLMPNFNKIVPLYLAYNLKTSIVRKQLISRGKTGTMTTIGQNDIATINIHFPTLPEQQKIASFITAIDTKIEQLTKKKSLLEQYKKGVMQQIFNQDLRFKDENGNEFPDWEEKKLEDIGIDIIDGDRGVNYPNGNDFSKSGYCLFLNAKNVTKNGFSFIETSFITKEKDSVLRKGKLKRFDIVLTTRGSVGHIAYYDRTVPFENLRINSGMVLIRINHNDINSMYLYDFFKSNKIQNEIDKVAFGSAQPQLTVKEISKFKILFPSITEQTQIANFLTAIDTKIELVNIQLENTQKFKKGLLQQMFV